MKLVLEEPLNNANTRLLQEHAHFEDVDIRGQELITVDVAKKYLQLRSVSRLTLWCGVTRAAMQHVVSRPNLTELIIFELKEPGTLSGFDRANCLNWFSCVHGGLTEADLLEVSKCKNLEKLGAQQSMITERALQAILALPSLTELDVEDSNFEDNHAAIIAQSKSIKRLEVGQCHISNIGLQHICQMKQLNGLDIWSNNIEADDLELLTELPNLEYLSLGGHDDQTIFTAENTIPKLDRIPSLKHIWLDGLQLSKDDQAYLNARYVTVR